VNLLHVSAGYPPFLGGAEVYAQTISERCVAEGHGVTFVATDAAEVEYYWNPHKHHSAPGRDSLHGVTVVRFRVSHLPLSPWSFYGFRRLATVFARLPGALPLLRWMARFMPGVPDLEATLEALPGPFDLVHGINIALEWPLLAAWRYARRHHRPFVATPFVHLGEHGSADVLINYVMPHQLEALRAADAVIVQTGIEGAALARLGVAEERIHRLGMGVALAQLQGGDAQRFRARHGLAHPLVTFLGVVTRDKGSFHLVRALEQLWAQGQAVHLAIAGPAVDEFKRFYAQLSTAARERTLLLGPVQGQDKLDLLAATDIFALPSRIDSFGIVYLEAWAHSKPVIGARAGGVPDVIADGDDGLLVDFGDVSGLAAAIQSLLADPARAQALGARGRAKVVARYTWDRLYGQLQQIYGRVTGASGCV